MASSHACQATGQYRQCLSPASQMLGDSKLSAGHQKGCCCCAARKGDQGMTGDRSLLSWQGSEMHCQFGLRQRPDRRQECQMWALVHLSAVSEQTLADYRLQTMCHSQPVAHVSRSTFLCQYLSTALHAVHLSQTPKAWWFVFHQAIKLRTPVGVSFPSAVDHRNP